MSTVFKVAIILLSVIQNLEGYQFVLIRKELSDLCLNNTCEDGGLHSICYYLNPGTNNCFKYTRMRMNNRRKSMLISGHNGIRNKFAVRYKIANMLLLHWDRDLEHMARGYLRHCSIAKDKYNETITVAMTYSFSPKLPLNRFVISIMRSWFLEINDISTFGQFQKLKPANMTVLTYPDAQFVGCASAKMFGGHMMACYYSPAYNPNFTKAYIHGEPCSACPEERASCSRTFKGLCGLDLYIPTSCSEKENAHLLLILSGFCSLIIIYWK